MVTRHLQAHELARRWSISPRTLERWRWIGEGPPYLKVGKRICYRLDDIYKFEAERIHQSGLGCSAAPEQ